MLRRRSSMNSLTLGANLSVDGNTTLGNASGDTLTITGTAVSTPNGLNFDSNTLVVDAANNRVGVATASPSVALDVTGAVTASGAITGGSLTTTGATSATGGVTLGGGVTVNGNTGTVVFSLATNGARLSLGTASRYFSDNGSKLQSTAFYVPTDIETPTAYITGDLNTVRITAYGGSNNLRLAGTQTDTGAAIALKFGNTTALTTAGGKIASFYSDNMSTEVASISYLGAGTFGSYNTYKSTTGITAFATGGQASATQLAAECNYVTTVATGGDSVKLPTAALGLRIVVYNLGANSVDIFPASGGTIDALAADAAYALASGASREFWGQSATQWRSKV